MRQQGHIQTVYRGHPPANAPLAGCAECRASCQSACKTSCTVGNQVCPLQEKGGRNGALGRERHWSFR